MGVNRPGRWALRRREWRVVRLLALRRDGFQCRHCGARRRLEVHHVKRVADHPELAFDLGNLMVLCARCHTTETNKELGNTPDPARCEWRRAVADLAAKPSSSGETKCLTV
jgi:5-methylcytosine-specific restriction endonuclease McrA